MASREPKGPAIFQFTALKQRSVFFAALVLFCIFISITAIVRTHDGSNDFDVFYWTGKAVLEGNGIYYAGEHYEPRPGIGPFLYPPFAACFFSLFAFLPLSVSAVIWVNLLAVLFILSVLLIFHFFDLSGQQIARMWKAVSLKQRLFYVFIMAVMLIDNLVMAQVNILTFFLCLAALVLWKKGRYFFSGVVLSAAIFLKLTAIIFCLYFAAKKAWKIFAGVWIGVIIFGFIIPAAVFGLEQNRLYHRQWFGKMIKPALVGVFEKVRPAPAGPYEKSIDQIKHEGIDQLLTDTNQSLPAVLTRLFLSGQQEHVVSQRYQGLPLGNGVGEEILMPLINLLTFAVLLSVCYVWWQLRAPQNVIITALEISVLFLTQSLLSPVTRSHYYIAWLFNYLTLFLIISETKGPTKIYWVSALLASLTYLCLALPGGEAFGAGAWANVIFWLGCLYELNIRTRKNLLGTI